MQRLVAWRESIFPVGFDAENMSRVRVTVIDSGLDDTHPFIQRQGWKRDRRVPGGKTPVPLFKDFTTSDTEKQHIPVDETGHGTFVAGIILQLAPDVELSVARISVDAASGNPQGGVENQIAAVGSPLVFVILRDLYLSTALANLVGDRPCRQRLECGSYLDVVLHGQTTAHRP
jgi:hypothetical protein